MKSFRSTALFAGIVLLFASYVYYFEYVKKNRDETKAEEAKKIFQVDKEAITEIHLKNIKSDTHLVLRKNQDQWSLTEPVSDLVEGSSIGPILSTIGSEKGEVVVEGEEVDLKEYGLDQPEGIVTVKTDKESFSVKIGTVKSFDGKSYVQDDKGGAVRLVDFAFADLLGKTASQLRDKRVLRRKLDDLTSIELVKNGKKQFVLEKKEGVWRFSEDEYPVGPEAIDSYLSTLENLRATEVVAEQSDTTAKGRYSLQKPAATLILGSPSERTVLEFGDAKDNLYIAVGQRPQILALAKTREKDIYKEKDAFKDKKHPFAFAADQVKSIRLETEKVKLEIVKDGSGGASWKLKAPVDGKILDDVKVDQLLRQIGDLEVGEFLRAKPGAGLKPPRNRVVLSTGEGLSVLELVWGDKVKQDGAKDDKGKEMVYVKTSKTDETLGVLQSQIDSLSHEGLLKEPRKENQEKPEATEKSSR